MQQADLKGAQDKRDVELRPHLLEDEVEKKAEAVKNLMTEDRAASVALHNGLPGELKIGTVITPIELLGFTCSGADL